MADEAALAALRWALENPEKCALGLVMLAGAWQWVREFRRAGREDNERESVLDSLLKENRELRRDRDSLSEENRALRRELREERRGHPPGGRAPQ